MADVDEYVEAGVSALLDLASREGAFIWSEAEAKISEGRRHDRPSVQPHHLTSARRLLLEGEALISEEAVSKGGHVIETFSLPDAPVRIVRSAASRKRLLQSRFLGWATGTRRRPGGLIGPAAESVVLRSMEQSATAGYRLEPVTNRGVERLYGADVPGGPLDAAAFLILADERSTPTGVGLVAVEVKNIRDWIYPNSVELYQLLDKCARLQNDDVTRALVPLLVCRRAHFTTFKMAKALGFYVIDLARQYLVPSADLKVDAVDEVRVELGYYDLMVGEKADPKLVRHFSSHLPMIAHRTSEVWRHSAASLDEHFKMLRVPGQSPSQRARVMSSFRELAAEKVPTAELVAGARPGGW